MTDITKYSEADLKEILNLLPPDTVLGRVDQHFIAANAYSFEQTADTEYDDSFDMLCSSMIVNQSYALNFNLKKDDDGVVVRCHEDPSYKIEEEARALYVIAEPIGKFWHLLKESKKDRYRRIAEYKLGL